MKQGIFLFALGVILCCLICFLSCTDDDSSTGPSNGASEPHLAIDTIFYSANIFAYNEPADWGMDDTTIVFGGEPFGSVWKVKSAANQSPVAANDTLSADVEDHGWRINSLADGRIAYYAGWFVGDVVMHIMAANADQINGSPAATVIHTFDDTDVGLTAGSSMSPTEMALSGDGNKLVGQWDSLFTLDWSTGSLVSDYIGDSTGSVVLGDLTPDGSKITFKDNLGNIQWCDFAADSVTTVGTGSYPSWNGDGTLLGFVGSGDSTYVVYNMSTKTSKSYSIPSTLLVKHPSLSRDGTKIVCRIGNISQTGLVLGTLTD